MVQRDVQRPCGAEVEGHAKEGCPSPACADGPTRQRRPLGEDELVEPQEDSLARGFRCRKPVARPQRCASAWSGGDGPVRRGSTTPAIDGGAFGRAHGCAPSACSGRHGFEGGLPHSNDEPRLIPTINPVNQLPFISASPDLFRKFGDFRALKNSLLQNRVPR
jgi:hypothetical protein